MGYLIKPIHMSEGTKRKLREDAIKAAKETAYQRIDKFHAHLDVCSQCRNHPFGLCPTGAKLLKEAATGQQK